MRIKIENEVYIDHTEILERLGISDSSFYILSKTQKVPQPIKLPARTFWKLREIEEFITKREGKQ